ncbi:hypothetical protein FI667_g1293, partial [Globisporangium splendens]
MVYPRANGSRSLSKFLALCAINLCVLHNVHAASAATTCDMVVSSGDAAVGIKIVTDPTCKTSPGTGCIGNDVCRFCKERDTPQPSHFLACDKITAPAAQAPTVAPTAASTPCPETKPPTVVPTVAPTTDKPIGGTVSVTECGVSDGDKAVGIQVVDDPACASGGLNCCNDHCRHCMVGDTPQSKHLLTCSSLGADYSTIAPIETPSVASDAVCEVSSGDFAVGITAVVDPDSPTLVTGGAETPSSTGSTTPASAVTSPGDAPAPTLGTSAPGIVAVTDTPAPTDTLAPGFVIVTDAPAPAVVTSIPGIVIATDTPAPTVNASAPGDVVVVVDTPAPAVESPGLWPSQTLLLLRLHQSEPTAVPPSREFAVSEGDAAAGVQLITSLDCVKGGLGCYQQMCRFCKVWETPQSTHLDRCSKYGFHFDRDDIPIGSSLDVTPSPTGDNTPASGADNATPSPTNETSTPPVDETPAPVDDTLTPVPAGLDTGLCVASEGDIAVGVHGIAATNCDTDGLGCFLHGACRFCKTAETPQSSQFYTCTSLLTPNTVTPASDECAVSQGDAAAGITAVNGTNCDIDGLGASFCAVSEGDAAVGISAVSANNCNVDNLDCFKDMCRFCKQRETEQSETYINCSSIDTTYGDDINFVPILSSQDASSPSAYTPAPTAAAISTPAPTVSTSTSPTTTTSALTPVACAAAVSQGDQAVGISAVADSNCLSGGVDCNGVNICRFCQVTYTIQSQNCLLCSSFPPSATAKVLRVRAAVNYESGVSGQFSKLLENEKAKWAFGIAAVVGVAAVVAMLVIGANRAVRAATRSTAAEDETSEDTEETTESDEQADEAVDVRASDSAIMN